MTSLENFRHSLNRYLQAPPLYVCKAIDKLTKNHRENDKESSSGIMPEIKESDLCPVKSFISYFEKFNPNTDRLWQRPRDSFLDSDEIWYNNVPVGKKTLSLFMSQLSQLCSLSLKYTNHSIRATGATLLSRAMFNPAQIMACLLYTSPSPRDATLSRMPSSA